MWFVFPWGVPINSGEITTSKFAKLPVPCEQVKQDLHIGQIEDKYSADIYGAHP